MPKKKIVVEEEEEDFEVEYIVKAKLSKGRKWEYLIKWGGYSEDENNWEPESNLTNCRRILKGFWVQTGMKSKEAAQTLAIGEEVLPSEEWIERQIKVYSATLEKNDRRKRKGTLNVSEEEGITDDAKDTESEVRAQGSKGDKAIKPPIEYSDPDDIPLSEVKADTILQTIPWKDKRKWSEEEEEDRPAHKRAKFKKKPKVVKQGDTELSQPAERVPVDLRYEGSPGHDPLFSDSDSDDEPLAQMLKAPAKTLPKSSRPAIIPAHVQRKMNPRVKSMAMEELNTREFQAISTKARLSGQSLSAEIGKSSATTAQKQKSISLDGDSWLKGNIISGSAKTDAPIVQPASASSSMVLPKERIKKRWRWSGQLAIGDNEAEDAYAEVIGEIELKDDFTLEASPTNLSIQHFIPNTVECLCLRHNYPLSMATLIMAGFKLSHFAKMYRSATASSNENSFQELAMYMTNNRVFSLAPLYIRDVRAATLFAFPTCFVGLNEQLKAPPKLWHGEGLLVAIGIQAYHAPKGYPVEPYNTTWKIQHIITKPSVVNPSLDRAMSLLGFPYALFERILGKDCSLFSPDKNLPDTVALDVILTKAGCKTIRLAGPPARFIFLHVADWNNLHKLPALVDRRLRPYVYFFTYGSDPSVDRRFWGVREVFPIGGVVTFTPRAIAEAPEATLALINKLDKHPLWTCYILPSVIGIMTDLIESESDNSKSTSTVEALCCILFSIDHGQLALTWHPPLSNSPDNDGDDLNERLSMWAEEQEHLCALSGFDLVVECQKRFKASTDRTEKDVEASVVKDMVAMQSELRNEYRRFVIIADSSVPINTSKEAAVNSSSSRAESKDMFEWSHLDNFFFGDDFFEITAPVETGQVPVTDLSTPPANL